MHNSKYDEITPLQNWMLLTITILFRFPIRKSAQNRKKEGATTKIKTMYRIEKCSYKSHLRATSRKKKEKQRAHTVHTLHAHNFLRNHKSDAKLQTKRSVPNNKNNKNCEIVIIKMVWKRERAESGEERSEAKILIVPASGWAYTFESHKPPYQCHIRHWHRHPHPNPPHHITSDRICCVSARKIFNATRFFFLFFCCSHSL